MENTIVNDVQKYSGYLQKLEQRALVGQNRRKYWFVLPKNSGVLYWYKNPGDFNCVGRIMISGAAFTFDPRENGSFEIHVEKKVYNLEAPNNKTRMEWLKILQQTRKRYHTIADPEISKNVVQLLDASTKTLNSTIDVDDTTQSESDSSSFSDVQTKENESLMTRSVFYLSPEGELTSNSLAIPSSSTTHPPGLVNEFVTKLSSGKQNIISRRPLSRIRASLSSKTESESGLEIAETSDVCDRCKNLVGKVQTQCHELTDEILAYNDLVLSLKTSLLATQNQRDALLREHNSAEKKLDFTLERESQMANLQMTISELRRQVEILKDENSKLEDENNSLNSTVDAFKESVRTKDELILKYCGESSSDIAENCKTAEIDVPEALLVDFGTPTDKVAQRVFSETLVNDVSEMKDLIDGYQNQNKFLNREVLDLQKIVHSFDKRERNLVRNIFNIEAIYYQLKSRYIMVLNHFRSASSPRRLKPETIQELIDEIQRPESPLNNHNSLLVTHTNLAFSGLTLSDNQLVFSCTSTGQFVRSENDPEIDSLGFYLRSPTSRPAILSPPSKIPSEADESGENKSEKASPISNKLDQNGDMPGDDWMLRLAADFQQKSNDIWANIGQGENKEFIDWLQRWDSFLINHVVQPLDRNDQLKSLIRKGIPHAYRGRVWKSLVNSLVVNTKAETGKGYYEVLLRKAEKVTLDKTLVDTALKQIDLDLSRTLPTNKFFDNEASEKVVLLRNVLYAFRFHNKRVEYCQGLNRIAAIGLLYLDEADAFWFMVACVEHLQPPDYYTKLAGAIVDQKILLDLIQEKIPTLMSHFRQLDIDMSLLTLPWFLTIFVDALSHNIYINIFDAFLYEGNKVLFRFAIAILKLLEPKLLECRSLTAVHACLSNLANSIREYKTLSNVAFNHLNPFSTKFIESRRQLYIKEHQTGISNQER